MSAEILVIDNYDSFVYTIVGYLEQLGARPTVRRNDAIGELPAALDGFDGVLVSPGPGTPSDAGASIAAIDACAARSLPMLGVCLGHQALGELFGGVVGHAPELMHGKTSLISHTGDGLFEGLASPLRATRYHSLAVDPRTLPDVLVPTAWVEGDPTLVMGIRHRELPLHAVQFHPESVLTEGGHRMLANWLVMCGDPDAVAASAGLAPLVES